MLSTLPTANQLRTETEFYDSALDSLEVIVDRLKQAGVTLLLSEVKGPVLDRLQRSEFLQHLTGRVFLSQHQAMSTLDPEVTARAAAGLKQVAAEA